MSCLCSDASRSGRGFEILRKQGSLCGARFSLEQHENARKAAEAANAANAQGKFFEYISVLFKNQKALDVPSLKKYASDLGLDRAKFDAALDRGMYAAEVQERYFRRRDVRSRQHSNHIRQWSATQNSECGRIARSD